MVYVVVPSLRATQLGLGRGGEVVLRGAVVDA
jgi:hypothetical protein